MIAYHVDGNLILQQPFKTKSDAHRLAVYNTIMTRLATKGLSVDLQIMDNEASAAFKQAIKFAWHAKFQLVPPDCIAVIARNEPSAPSRTISWLF
jgi:hypothetical protein